jgi:NADH-quinone oxidoreductase subunit H
MAVLMTNRTIYPIAKVMLYVSLFFGGVTLQDSWLLTFVIFFLKTFTLYMWSVFVGLSFPRFKVEQGVRWFLGLPALLGLLSILVMEFG